MLKRCISLLLLLAMVAGMLPALSITEVAAAETTSSVSSESEIAASVQTVTDLFNSRSKDVHPRIMASEDDFARIRKLVNTDPYMRMLYGRIYMFCEDLLSEPLLNGDFSRSDPSIGSATTQRVLWGAMIWHISGERRFAERAVQEMINACAYSDWHPSSYLDTASMCFAIGLGYDWLYHFMTEDERTTIRNGLYDLGLSTLENPTETIRQRLTENHNWNPWCNGGLSVAAAAVFEDYPELSAQIISNAVSNIPLSMHYSPNGAYPEGPDYSICGLSFTVYFMDTLDSVLGTDFGLSDLTGFQDTGKYLIATNGYTTNFNFGDGNDGIKDCGILHWYAKRFNMPELSVYQRDRQTSNLYFDEYLSLLWYDPDLAERATDEEEQLDYLLYNDYFESVATFRSFSDDERQIYTAIKSGANLTAHSNMDIGTFVMEAMGEIWFADLGKDNYDLTGYFDRFEDTGTRWTYYCTRAEGQNTIVVNPDSLGGQSVDAQCQITDYMSGYDGGYATVDMTDAYDDYSKVTSATRSLALFDNRMRVRLRDEITCSEASTIYWFAHTQADISISTDGKTATLIQNGKTLLAQIPSSSDAVFTSMEAVPLSTSPNPSGQTANEGFSKLVIKLTNVTSATIDVVFTPVLTSSDEQKSLPTQTIENMSELIAAYDPAVTALKKNAQNEFVISTVEELCFLAQWVKDGKYFTGQTVRLINDIDMKGRTLMPIGGAGSGINYNGIFEGDNHVIKNLVVFKPQGEKVGFFGATSSNAAIRNFGIESGTIIAKSIAGGLIGEARDNTSVSNCFSCATVVTYPDSASADGRSGGLIGQTSMESTITVQNSYANCDVLSGGKTAGGLVGYIAKNAQLTLTNCYYVGKTADASGNGGMIGSYSDTVAKVTATNCYSSIPLKSASISVSEGKDDYTTSRVLNKAQMVTVAIDLGEEFIYDCEWKNGGYPILQWQNATTLPDDLYLSTVAQLRLVAYNVNAGITDYDGKTIRLTRDIDLENREWTPIGGNSNKVSAGSEDVDLDAGKSFEGTFDGQGYSVLNMRITSGNHYVGFFGNMRHQVKNLGIERAYVEGGRLVGALAGRISAAAIIKNSFAQATVTGVETVGGLVGTSGQATITDVYAVGNVTATDGDAGGLIGTLFSWASNTKITNAYAACTVTAKRTGGLVCDVINTVTGVEITNAYALTGPLVYTELPEENYKLVDCEILTETTLKAVPTALADTFKLDNARPLNFGYPVLKSSIYKSAYGVELKPLSTNEKQYEIHTVKDLRALAYMVNELGMSFSGKTVKLCADLDLGSEEWIPIGGNAPGANITIKYFVGTFDGGGHTIYNLSISSANRYVGLFGEAQSAVIKNVGIESGRVWGGNMSAGLCGSMRGGDILNCYNKANVCGSSYVAGVVGYLIRSGCEITNCYNSGLIGGSDGSVGGIAGQLASSAGVTFTNCYNRGSVSSGIVGAANSAATLAATNCYTVTGTVLGSRLTEENGKVIALTELMQAAPDADGNVTDGNSNLGTGYAKDFFTKNRLYPVLAWENAGKSTELTLVDGVYQINTADDLRLLSYYVRNGETFSGKNFVLNADLDMENKPFLPIGGKDVDGTTNRIFKGNFNGKNHKIYRLNIFEMDAHYTGLFGWVQNSTITALGIESGSVIGNDVLNSSGKTEAFCGSIVANMAGSSKLIACYNKAVVFAPKVVGGLVGYINGNCQILSCFNRGSTQAKSRLSTVGGLVGQITSNAQTALIEDCYSVGNYVGFVATVSSTNKGTPTVKNSYTAGHSIVAISGNTKPLVVEGAKRVSKATLRGYADVLNANYDYFLDDTDDVNNGYPVLCYHIYESVVTAPTCTAQGYTTHTCIHCGKTYDDTYVDATGHSYDTGAITTKPTLSEDGVKTFTCLNGCGKTYTEGLDKLPEYLLFDFGDSGGSRYDNYAYDFINFDRKSHWIYNTKRVSGVSVDIIEKTLVIDVIGEYHPDVVNDPGAYVDVSKNGTSSDKPLHFNPEKAEVYQIRFKMENLQKTATPVFDLQFSAKKGTETVSPNPNTPDQPLDESILTSGQYVTITVPLNGIFEGCTEIPYIRAYFKKVKSISSQQPGKITIDYIYIGPRSQMPTNQYTVTFKNYDGTVLQEVVVHEGEAAAYTASTPTKPADGTSHYTFNGWDKTFTNVTSNLTVTAKFKDTTHSYENYQKQTDPTKDQTGSIVGTCSCGQTNTVVLPALSETNYTISVKKAATCTATGVDTYTWKDEAYGIFSYDVTTSSLGHSYTTKVTAPTCTAQGYTTYTCSACGHSYKDNYTDATGHSYSYEVTKKPTTSAKGVLTGTCSKCNGTVTIELPMLNTTAYTYKVEKAATCTALGIGRYTWITTTYGTFYFDVDIPMIAHIYTSKVTAPTCTAQGYTTYTCSACGHSYKDNYVNATDHNYDNGVVTTQPTCTSEGVKTFTCLNDSTHFYTEQVAKLLHTDGNSDGKCDGCGCNTNAKAQSIVLTYARAVESNLLTKVTIDDVPAELMSNLMLTGVIYVDGSDERLGTAVLLDADGDGKLETLRFTPTDVISKVIYLNCTVKITDEAGNEYQRVIPVSVVPATIMYYETDFTDGVFEQTVVKQSNTQTVNDSEFLYFDFKNSNLDRIRYTSPVYNGENYDIGSWSRRTKTLVELDYNNAEGTLALTTKEDLSNVADVTDYHSHYIQTSYLNYSAKNAETDVIYVRLKVENFDTSKQAYAKVHFYPYADGTTTEMDIVRLNDNNDYKKIEIDQKYLENESYFTLEIPASELQNYENISRIRITLDELYPLSDRQGVITYDYIYIGKKANFEAVRAKYNQSWQTIDDGTNAANDEGKTEQTEIVYGYDSVYENDIKLSNGSSLYVEGAGVPPVTYKTDENGNFILDEEGKKITVIDYTSVTAYTEASFTFTGTGFDIISRTGKDQGMIRAVVLDSTGAVVKNVSVNSKGVLELYQIPVLSIHDMAYGTYTVKIFVNEAFDYGNDGDEDVFGGAMDRGGEFYFDAVRIYDPINTKDTQGDGAYAYAVYQTHGEADPTFTELRDILIHGGNFTAGSNVNGVVYLDAKAKAGTTFDDENGKLTQAVAEYKAIGPNNEVYLSPGNAIAFKLEVDGAIPASIDIGAKSVDGTEVSMSVAITATVPTTLPTGITRRLQTATALFYPMGIADSQWKNEVTDNRNTRYVYVTIYNSGSEGILSITDIKYAYDFPNPDEPSMRKLVRFVVDLPMLEQYATNSCDHVWDQGEITTAPTCIAEGVKTFTCSICGDSFTETVPALGHSYTDGVCSCGQTEGKELVEETTWKLGHTLNLASDISINYAIAKTTLAGYDMDSVYVLAEIDTYKNSGEVGIKEVKILPVENGSYYYFTLEGLTAVNMNDEIRTVLYGTKDGKVHYSPVDTYSVATYAYAQLAKPTMPRELKVLCAELLRYGTKAQIFKSYRLDALVDAKMTADQKALLSDLEAVTFGNTNLTENIPETNSITWLGKSLDLASKVSVKFIFTLGSYAGATEDLTMKVIYKDIHGKDKELMISDVEVYNADYGYYAFTLDSLLAAELRSVLTVQILAGDTVVSGTLQYSADTYGNGKSGTLGDLCKALFAYSDSAKSYFQ